MTAPTKVPLATPISTPSQWLDILLVRIFRAIHTTERDNFDANRYRGQSQDDFFAEHHAQYFSFLLRNLAQFFQTRQLLEDEQSRALFDHLVLYRTLGHLHVRLPFNNPENRAHLETAESWRVVDTEDAGQFGPLAIFLAPGISHDIHIKGWRGNVAATFLYRQYYFSRGGVTVEAGHGDQVIDAGGCFGDTALAFADAVGDAGHVYVFDPLPMHCAIIGQTLAMNPALAPRISIYPFGLTDEVNDAPPLPFDHRINPGARIEAGIPTLTIDAAVGSHGVSRVDFIKMDIEGSELGALRGAEASIRRWCPKLAISLYHRPEDFFSIPAWINSLGLGYRFFLDHYSIHHEETVLYATL